jgi:hypothetical protein
MALHLPESSVHPNGPQETEKTSAPSNSPKVRSLDSRQMKRGKSAQLGTPIRSKAAQSAPRCHRHHRQELVVLGA